MIYRETISIFFVCISAIDSIFLKNNYDLLENEISLDDLEIDNRNVALIINDTPENFQNVLSFVDSIASENSVNDHDIWLITFNSSGVSKILERSYRNKDAFLNSLKNLTIQSKLKTTLDTNSKSLPFYAIFQTAKIMPKNGVIIVFFNSLLDVDNTLENTALNIVLSKNITVHTISSNESSKDLLKNIRQFSGGMKININQQRKHEDYFHNIYVIPSNLSIVVSKKNLLNTNELSFPIDYDVTGIHIIIKPSKNTNGVLISPAGYKFPFSNNLKSIYVNSSSEFKNHNNCFDIHLNFSTSNRPTIGTWKLTLENFKQSYNVSVFAFTNIIANSHTNSNDYGLSIDENPKDVVKLGVIGNISHITDISLLNTNGETVLGNVSNQFNKNRLKYVTDIYTTDIRPDIADKEVHIEISQRTQPLYALIRGKDVKGNIFQRMSYIFGKSDMYPQQSITIEVGLGSELVLATGRTSKVFFEVTNYGTNAQLVFFSCSDSKYILHSLSEYKSYLEPQESTIATLNLNPVYGAYTDEITFSATSGPQVVHKKILVDVGTWLIDQSKPEITYKYTSDCTGVIFSKCSKGTWRIEIMARDAGSGLLQVNTEPKGLFFPYGYTSGTRDTVTGFYSESCCNPDLQISAVDRLNNRISYSVNAYHARLSPGAIAAIVLGILFFLILVGVITFLAIKKWNKKKESYDLPTYKGGGI